MAIPAPLTEYFQRVMERESVRKALAEEGLVQSQGHMSQTDDRLPSLH